MSFLQTGRALLLGTALSIAMSATAVRAGSYQVLHSFTGSDGSFANGNLVLDSAGNLYGTASEGGSLSHGNIFKLSSTGDFSVLYSFSGGSDGGEPSAGLAIDPVTGDLYGTTDSGGGHGQGGIFKLTSAGAFAVLHDFDAKTDGDQTLGALTLDGKGNLYGLNFQDGPRDYGTVFELTAGGTFNVLSTLSSSGGAEPLGRLEKHRDKLVGVATIGGSGSGTIFQVTTDGTFTLLESMLGGEGLSGGVARDKTGNLYGGDFSGGEGIIYALSPSGTLSTLYSFTGGADGRIPVGDLLRSGKTLYGAAARGGGGGDDGTVFKLDLQGNFTLLHDFTGAPGDGAAPSGGLVKGKGGILYGTTTRGGAKDKGVIFSVSDK
jgi:uncharacterized repeat protein (TIGR03803 family)